MREGQRVQRTHRRSSLDNSFSVDHKIVSFDKKEGNQSANVRRKEKEDLQDRRSSIPSVEHSTWSTSQSTAEGSTESRFTRESRNDVDVNTRPMTSRRALLLSQLYQHERMEQGEENLSERSTESEFMRENIINSRPVASRRALLLSQLYQHEKMKRGEDEIEIKGFISGSQDVKNLRSKSLHDHALSSNFDNMRTNGKNVPYSKKKKPVKHFKEDQDTREEAEGKSNNLKTESLLQTLGEIFIKGCASISQDNILDDSIPFHEVQVEENSSFDDCSAITIDIKLASTSRRDQNMHKLL
jgi:hypothetical protein